MAHQDAENMLCFYSKFSLQSDELTPSFPKE